jgi:hypothetical protein
MINLTRNTVAEEIEVDDEIDFDGDEYGDNEKAAAEYATVVAVTEWWDGETGYPWITLHTTQGSFEMPAGHNVRLKVVE